MEFSFTKMNGLGNDFVFVDDLEARWEPTPAQVSAICDRHFGVGADGVILVRPAKEDSCDAFMHYFNADGSLAEMCGNGVRCFAKYLVDHRIVDPAAGKLVAGTRAGAKPISYQVDEQGLLTVATVDMGEPILKPQDVPTTLPANARTEQGTEYVREAAVSSPWGDFAFTCVSMGNPHAVCFLDDIEALPEILFTSSEKSLTTLDIARVGAWFESNPVFPAKANIEFAVCAGDHIEMRVYERGDGETLACGTGTCATSVAATLTGRAGRENDVQLLGGMLHIRWAENDHVFMTGAAATSFTGTMSLPDED